MSPEPRSREGARSPGGDGSPDTAPGPPSGRPARGAGPLRVLHVVQALNAGGMELMLLRTLPRFDPERFRVRVVCLAHEGALAPRFREAGFEPVVLGLRGRLTPRTLWRLARFFRRERAEIVHSHMHAANTTARVAARLARVPVVVAQEENLAGRRSRRQLLVDRLCARWCDRIVAVSRAVADSYAARARIRRDKFEVIPNGVDLEHFETPFDRAAKRAELGLAPGAAAVGTVARLVPLKNHEVLLRAAREVLAARPGAVLLLAGSGPYEPALRALARELGVDSAVRFLGYREDVPDLLRALDVFVLPSRTEGGPLAVIEALAAGLPVVTTDGGGPVLEMIRPGVSAILVPTGNAQALAQGILKALLPEVTAALRAAALARAKEFSMEQAASRYGALYERLAQEKGLR